MRQANFFTRIWKPLTAGNTDSSLSYDEFKDLMAKRKLGCNAMSPKDEVAVRPDAPPQAGSGGGASMQSLQAISERSTYDF